MFADLDRSVSTSDPLNLTRLVTRSRGTRLQVRESKVRYWYKADIRVVPIYVRF